MVLWETGEAVIVSCIPKPARDGAQSPAIPEWLQSLRDWLSPSQRVSDWGES